MRQALHVPSSRDTHSLTSASFFARPGDAAGLHVLHSSTVARASTHVFYNVHLISCTSFDSVTNNNRLYRDWANGSCLPD